MDTMVIDAETTRTEALDADRSQSTDACDGVSSLEAMYEPSQALAAARRLYRRNRSGLRFFCENRRVVPVEELELLGELHEDGVPLDPERAAVFARSVF